MHNIVIDGYDAEAMKIRTSYKTTDWARIITKVHHKSKTLTNFAFPLERDSKNVSIHEVWKHLEDHDYEKMCVKGHYFITVDRRAFECLEFDVKCVPKYGSWKKYDALVAKEERVLRRARRDAKTDVIARSCLPKQEHSSRWVRLDRRYWPKNFVPGDAEGKKFTTKGLYTASLHFKILTRRPVKLPGYHYCWDESPYKVFHNELFSPVVRDEKDRVAGWMHLRSFGGEQEKLLLCFIRLLVTIKS